MTLPALFHLADWHHPGVFLFWVACLHWTCFSSPKAGAENCLQGFGLKLGKRKPELWEQTLLCVPGEKSFPRKTNGFLKELQCSNGLHLSRAGPNRASATSSLGVRIWGSHSSGKQHHPSRVCVALNYLWIGRLLKSEIKQCEKVTDAPRACQKLGVCGFRCGVSPSRPLNLRPGRKQIENQLL